MHLRDATISDIPHLGTLFLAAFRDDLDYDAVYPWRATAPGDFAQLMTAEIRQMFLQGKGRFLVVETEQLRVVGCAFWTRKGSSPAAVVIRARNDSTLKVLERKLCHLQETLHYPFVRVFALAPGLPDEGSLIKQYNVVYNKFCAELWVGELEEHWLLQKLCVHPEWRRQGIASILLRWGQDRARKEGVVVCLNSTQVGMAMYGKAGFVQVASCEMVLLGVTVRFMVWRP